MSFAWGKEDGEEPGEYDQVLQERGSLTVWVTPEALAAWQALPTGKRGCSRYYSDLAIETRHLLRLVLVGIGSRPRAIRVEPLSECFQDWRFLFVFHHLVLAEVVEAAMIV